jgi:hypothetical protein
MTMVLIANRSNRTLNHPGYPPGHHRTAVTSCRGNSADA